MSESVECSTTLLGRIFGHKFHQVIRLTGRTLIFENCLRCGWKREGGQS